MVQNGANGSVAFYFWVMINRLIECLVLAWSVASQTFTSHHCLRPYTDQPLYNVVALSCIHIQCYYASMLFKPYPRLGVIAEPSMNIRRDGRP